MHLFKMTMLFVFFDMKETHEAEAHISILPYICIVHLLSDQLVTWPLEQRLFFLLSLAAGCVYVSKSFICPL